MIPRSSTDDPKASWHRSVADQRGVHANGAKSVITAQNSFHMITVSDEVGPYSPNLA